MLYEVMKSIRNFFPAGIYFNGVHTIKDGSISLDLKNGQYFLIEGSLFNDGVYEYPATGLTDESFNGVISVLIPPMAFLNVVKDIEAYEAKNGAKNGFISESFGGYSYTKATDKNGDVYGWQDVFKKRLNVWRKV